MKSKKSEEFSLNLTENQKIMYRQDKIFFDFFKAAYMRIIKRKKNNKYERIIYKKRILSQKYFLFLKKYIKKIKKLKRLKLKRKKYLNYGRRSKKTI